jgi:hypothetical protein
MNMPREVILALKNENTKDIEKKEAISNNSSLLDKIILSYDSFNKKKNDYIRQIKNLRNDANKLKEEISLKNNTSNKTIKFTNESEQQLTVEDRVEKNNISIKEETCDTAIKYLHSIKSNISKNSKEANDILAPLEASFDLLKTQVEYTLLLENILDLFKKKKQLEEKLNESNQIISMLAESLDVKNKEKTSESV